MIAQMDANAWLTLTGIAVAVVLSILSGGSSIVVAFVGWLMKRSVDAADVRLASMDDKLTCLPKIETHIAVLTERTENHAKRLDNHSVKIEELSRGK